MNAGEIIKTVLCLIYSNDKINKNIMGQTAQFWHNHQPALIAVNNGNPFKYLMPLSMQYCEFAI
jgi:hypothetical protein